MNACLLRSLPPAVLRKRFFAPECVFIFGIAQLKQIACLWQLAHASPKHLNLRSSTRPDGFLSQFCAPDGSR